MAHFVWYLEKEKRSDIWTLPIDRVPNKKHFYGKNMHQKLVPVSFFNFGKKTQKRHCMQEIILKMRYFERGLSKSLKNVKFIFFFRTQSLLMDMIMKEKRSLSFFRLQNKVRKIPILVMHHLTKFEDVQRFLNYSKNYIC